MFSCRAYTHTHTHPKGIYNDDAQNKLFIFVLCIVVVTLYFFHIFSYMYRYWVTILCQCDEYLSFHMTYMWYEIQKKNFIHVFFIYAFCIVGVYLGNHTYVHVLYKGKFGSNWMTSLYDLYNKFILLLCVCTYMCTYIWDVNIAPVWNVIAFSYVCVWLGYAIVLHFYVFFFFVFYWLQVCSLRLFVVHNGFM